jgi:hypothetical protein
MPRARNSEKGKCKQVSANMILWQKERGSGRKRRTPDIEAERPLGRVEPAHAPDGPVLPGRTNVRVPPAPIVQRRAPASLTLQSQRPTDKQHPIVRDHAVPFVRRVERDERELVDGRRSDEKARRVRRDGEGGAIPSEEIGRRGVLRRNAREEDVRCVLIIDHNRRCRSRHVLPSFKRLPRLVPIGINGSKDVPAAKGHAAGGEEEIGGRSGEIDCADLASRRGAERGEGV